MTSAGGSASGVEKHGYTREVGAHGPQNWSRGPKCQGFALVSLGNSRSC